MIAVILLDTKWNQITLAFYAHLYIIRLETVRLFLCNHEPVHICSRRKISTKRVRFPIVHKLLHMHCSILWLI